MGPFRVGDGARVASGAVVLDEVPDNATAVGVPARIVRINGIKTCNLDQIHVSDPVAQELCRLSVEHTKLKLEVEDLKSSLLQQHSKNYCRLQQKRKPVIQKKNEHKMK